MEKNKKKKTPIIFWVIIIIAIAVIAFSAYKILSIQSDYSASNDQYEELEDDYVNVDGEVTDDADEKSWFTNVHIDFDSLQAENPDIVGWIRFDNTDVISVDYPILYSGDNETYLRNDIYGNARTAGSIFIDGMNSGSLDNQDYHTIIYGHNMKNGSMFGTLKKYKNDDTIYDANKYFTIYTPTAAYRYEIFSYFDADSSGYVYTIGYIPSDEYQSFIDELCADSMKDTGVVPTSDQFTVSLSTCTGHQDDVRFTVHAVCIDVEYY